MSQGRERWRLDKGKYGNEKSKHIDEQNSQSMILANGVLFPVGASFASYEVVRGMIVSAFLAGSI